MGIEMHLEVGMDIGMGMKISPCDCTMEQSGMGSRSSQEDSCLSHSAYTWLSTADGLEFGPGHLFLSLGVQVPLKLDGGRCPGSLATKVSTPMLAIGSSKGEINRSRMRLWSSLLVP